MPVAEEEVGTAGLGGDRVAGGLVNDIYITDGEFVAADTAVIQADLDLDNK